MSLVLFTLSFLGPLSHFLTEDLQLKDQKSYNLINYPKQQQRRFYQELYKYEFATGLLRSKRTDILIDVMDL